MLHENLDIRDVHYIYIHNVSEFSMFLSKCSPAMLMRERERTSVIGILPQLKILMYHCLKDTVPCDECDKRFMDAIGMAQHKETVHNKKHACTIDKVGKIEALGTLCVSIELQIYKDRILFYDCQDEIILPPFLILCISRICGLHEARKYSQLFLFK